MGLYDYLQNILPTNETATVTRSIKNLKKVIGCFTLPPAEALLQTLDHNWDFKDPEMAKLNKFFVGELPKRMDFKYRSPNVLHCMVYGLQTLLKNLDVVESVVPDLFKADTFSAVGVSYNKATVLQYVEAADFYVKYSRCLLNYASSVELANIQGVKDVRGIGPNDLDYLKRNRFNFIKVAGAVSITISKTKELLKKTTDMLVTSDSDSVAVSVVGKSALDPFGFSSLPFPISYIFRIRMNMMASGVDDYEAAKAEALSVEYRIMLIKEHIENGNGDAVVERSLEVQEDRLLKLKRNIEKTEEAYDLN